MPSPFAKSYPDASRLWLLVLAGGIVMGLALGVRHVQGLFLLPVSAGLVPGRVAGWHRVRGYPVL